MLDIICFCLFFASVQGHNNLLRADAALQSALMPQELNPAFVSEKDTPWRAFLPLERDRRDTDLSLEIPSLNHIKKYSRVVTCIVLALSAVAEITLYLIEIYYGA